MTSDEEVVRGAEHIHSYILLNSTTILQPSIEPQGQPPSPLSQLRTHRIVKVLKEEVLAPFLEVLQISQRHQGQEDEQEHN